MEENTTGFVRKTNSILTLVLSLLLILTTFFSTGFYMVNRINSVENKVAIESELRKRVEQNICEINTKLDKIIERLPERTK